MVDLQGVVHETGADIKVADARLELRAQTLILALVDRSEEGRPVIYMTVRIHVTW